MVQFVPLLSYLVVVVVVKSLLIDNDCEVGFSGVDCDIPYEACPNTKRNCFNNSKCIKNNKIDEHTGEYGYHCDCSFAAGISNYAGHECEHSATVLCPKSRDEPKEHFCTNGGLCGKYITKKHRERHGCFCTEDYEGAHCQFLVGTMNQDLGEIAIPEYGPNFYGFQLEDTKNERTAEDTVVTIIIFIVVSVALGTVGILTYRKLQWNRLGIKSTTDNNDTTRFIIETETELKPTNGDII